MKPEPKKPAALNPVTNITPAKPPAPSFAVTAEQLYTFTGTTHTIVYRPHEGFANYAIASITMNDGKIIKTELSQPYAAFEALVKLETINDKQLEKMRRGYPADYRHV